MGVLWCSKVPKIPKMFGFGLAEAIRSRLAPNVGDRPGFRYNLPIRSETMPRNQGVTSASLIWNRNAKRSATGKRKRE
jgi:hypothetical protein